MDAQAIVFDRYPDAEAIEEPPVFRHGDLAPFDRGYWGIFADSGAVPLGDGATEDEAWDDAARKLKAADHLDQRRVGHIAGLRSHTGHSRLARMLHLLG
jgi:hypothetical protein